MKTKVIEITVSGPVQSGKSCLVREIQDLLIEHGYCAVIPYRALRHNPAPPLVSAAYHEKPNPDFTVVVLHERTRIELQAAGQKEIGE